MKKRTNSPGQGLRPFLSLTERGRARRLRTLALNALALYDLGLVKLSLVTNEMNGIFRVDSTDGLKFILRVTNPEGGHSYQHVLGEMDWLFALSNQTDLNVPKPLRSRDGSLVVRAHAPGVPEERFCVIFSWVHGVDLYDVMGLESMKNLGNLMARLHRHAQTYTPPPDLNLLRFDKVFPFPEPVVLFDQDKAHHFNPQQRLLFLETQTAAQRSLQGLMSSGEPMRILHGDLHQWNVRSYRGRLSPIDFEDLMWGWPVQDIATCLYYLVDDTKYPQLKEAFYQGYTQVSPWPERSLGEINSFIGARGLGMINFVLQGTDPLLLEEAPELIEKIESRLRRLMVV